MCTDQRYWPGPEVLVLAVHDTGVGSVPTCWHQMLLSPVSAGSLRLLAGGNTDELLTCPQEINTIETWIIPFYCDLILIYIFGN